MHQEPATPRPDPRDGLDEYYRGRRLLIDRVWDPPPEPAPRPGCFWPVVVLLIAEAVHVVLIGAAALWLFGGG